MSQTPVADLDEATLGQPAERAARNGRSIEAEIKAILLEVLPKQDRWARTNALRENLARSGREFPDSTPLIREDGNVRSSLKS